MVKKNFISQNHFIIIVFIFLFINNVNCRSQNSQSDSPKSNNSLETEDTKHTGSNEYSGVYEGLLDMFGFCEYDTATSLVYFDCNIEPIIIIYDGSLLENYKLEDNIVFTEKYGYKEELGRFINQNGQQGFLYKRILNSFYEDLRETSGIEPSFLSKIKDFDKNDLVYQKYLEENNQFKEFWKSFEKAFFQKDIEFIIGSTLFPITDYTSSFDLKTYNKNNFRSFISKLINDTKERMAEYEPDFTPNFPQRYTNNDPCFPKAYIWSFSNPFLYFEKVDDNFKLTKFVSFN